MGVDGAKSPRSGNFWKPAARVATAALAVLAMLPACAGCGSGGMRHETYTITSGGVAVGSEALSVGVEAGSRVYRSTVRRPYLPYDTTVYQQLYVSTDLTGFLGFNLDSRVPGASYRTYLTRKNGTFDYLRDDLQTFDFIQGLQLSSGFLPLEPDSACDIQALIDRLLASGQKQLVLMTVAPSRNMTLRETYVTLKKDGTIEILAAGLGDYAVSLDSGWVLVEATNRLDGTKIERGGGGKMTSKPYKPSRHFAEEVRVTTVDGLLLAGSLYLPTGRKPPYKAVVLAGDHGPQDRTGAGFLSQVADNLAGNGFAVLTCDKRGIPKSKGEYGTYTLDSAVSDLDSQVDYLVLRGDIDIDHLAVVGYGEGGIVASTAAMANPYITACVLMATPSVSLFPDLALLGAAEEVRAGRLQPVESDAETARINYLAGLVQSNPSDGIILEGHRLFLGWMRSYMNHSTPDTLKMLEIPVQVVQGADDTVVPASQADEVMAALESRGGYGQDLVMLGGLGHDFGGFAGEAESKPYRSHPEVQARALDAVSSWLKGKMDVR